MNVKTIEVKFDPRLDKWMGVAIGDDWTAWIMGDTAPDALRSLAEQVEKRMPRIEDLLNA